MPRTTILRECSAARSPAVRPVAEADFLLQQPNQLPGIASGNQPGAFGQAEGVEDFDPLPGRPQDLHFWLAVEQGDGRRAVRVATGFVGEPPEVSA